MGKKLKSILVRSATPVLTAVLRIFFDKKYLSGRHFIASTNGLKWGLRAAWSRNVLRLGKVYPWPVALGVKISNPENIEFDVDDLNNFQSHGVYFQCYQGRIVIGKGSYIAPNVGIITANHNLDNLEHHSEPRVVRIGPNCWIGMNAVILPGVELGPQTVVGAGAVVTKSFPEGHVIVGGVPARALRSSRIDGVIGAKNV